MNRIITVIFVVVLFSGCASTQYERKMTPAEQHQAAKTQYYDNVNQRQNDEIIEESLAADAQLDRAPIETAMRLEK